MISSKDNDLLEIQTNDNKQRSEEKTKQRIKNIVLLRCQFIARTIDSLDFYFQVRQYPEVHRTLFNTDTHLVKDHGSAL